MKLSGIRAVLAVLLVLGAGSVGLASDRVRIETGVDRAVATLGVSGEGVIVAIMDRGIDWESNDFRNEDGTTRIAYIFDLYDDSGAADPNNPYGHGTVYTREQIDRALFGGARLATRDYVGHGTTTTGLAAGNGRNSTNRKHRGVAPKATIISVKLATEGPEEEDWWAGDELAFLGMEFVVDKARELGMPVVMLFNFGSIGGPTDGTSRVSRRIDAMVGPDHPGVVFDNGTGDDGVPSKTQNRAAAEVPNGGTLGLRFALDRGAGYLEVWYDRTEAFAVSIETPTGMFGPYPASQFEATGVGFRVFRYRGGDDFYGSANSKRLLRIDFDGAAGAGEYVLRLDHEASSAGSDIHFDASLNTPFGESGRFLNHVTPGSISDSATAFHNVAPNSYVIRTQWTDIDGVDRRLVGQGDVGELWTGSSIGPTVDGRIGVDVSAPGDRVITTYAPRFKWAAARWNLIVGGGGLYGLAGAVSAAAPIVTGIIALMLEVDPTLDAVTVKRILQETARADEFTGPIPNPLWGHGKVDAFEALMAVRRGSTGGTTRAPRPSGSIPAQTLAVARGATSLRVAQYFIDPDDDVLTYTARSSRIGVVTVAVSNSMVTLTPVAPGTVTVTVTARDPGGLSATQSFTVEMTAAGPPFSGTAFISPDILTTADPSGLTGVTYTGRGDRTIWDYRVLDWITVNTYLFKARIRGRNIEFQVNPEFGSVDAARAEVDTYALALGRLPAVLLSRAEKVHVNAGDPAHPDAAKRGRVPKVFGANYFDRSITMHTGNGQRLLRDGYLEEVLFHEGAHVSLQNHQDTPGWRAAQEADGEYISDYARDHPDSEDVAESLLLYFAMRYRPDRISTDHRAAIADTIPNRMEYFDGLALDWSPYTPAVSSPNQPSEDQIYYFPHLAVGAGWQTTLTYINYSPEEVTCQTEFLSGQGTPLMVSFPSLGSVDSRTDVLPPGGSVHEETDVGLSAALAVGWARATCSGPVKASLLFRQYDSAGVAVAEAGVNAAAAPATRFVTFAERAPGELGTGVAYANPSDTAAVVTFTARDETGRMLPSVKQTLMPNGHGAQNMAGLFPSSSFTGSLEITSTEPIVSLSLNAEAPPIFSSLPPGEPDAAAQGPTTYYFPHLAVGASWQTTLTYINDSPEEVTCETEFISDHGTPLLVSFPGQGTVMDRTDVLPAGGSVHEETDVELGAMLAPGWAKASCTRPVKASLLFRQYDSEGNPVAEAGVNAAAVAATRFVTFAEQAQGKTGTAVAYANPSETAAHVTFTAKDTAGQTLASVVRTVLPDGHDAHVMSRLFGFTSFSGSLEITSKVPIVSLSLNFEAAPVFSSLPPGEVEESAP